MNSTENLIPWSLDYQLTWDDFQGERIFDKRQAESVLILRRDEADTEIFEQEGKYYFKIINLNATAYFKQNESWVLEKQKKAENAVIILKHEQGHFDITEIYARKYRSKLNEIKVKIYKCEGNDDRERKQNSEKKGRIILDKIEKTIGKELGEIQENYDNKTNFGVKVKAQAKYLRWIKKELSKSGNDT